MMHLATIKITVPLKQKFVVSKGEATSKTIYLTVLNNRYSGEASGSVHYGPTQEEIERDLEAGLKKVAKFKNVDMNAIEEVGKFKIDPIAKSALVGMLLHYMSGESRRYPWEILQLGSPVGIKSSMTISIDKPNEMIKALENCDYPIIKIKMGNEEDVMILDALDSLQGKEVRVDANGAWSCAKAEEMIFHLSRKGVKVIEQPTDIQFVAEWPHLKGKTGDVHLIVDEGLNTMDDYRKSLRLRRRH